MEVKLYKIFIGSPSDTAAERNICDKVFEELNKSIGSIFNFKIESIKWENDVRPTIQAKDGQATINGQIGDDYDIFIGIMSKKFGSPTSRAGSGTEEEFNNAFGRFTNKENVEVIFYFNDEAPKTMSAINTEEFIKIEKFKSKISHLGIYGTYLGVLDFEEKLRKNLTHFFINRYKENVKNSGPEITEVINKEALRKIFAKRFNDALIGFEEQPVVWVEPVLSKSNEIFQNADENYNQKVHVQEVIYSGNSYIIKAPPQFGLTSLAHFIVKEAWENDKLVIYLDSELAKPHTIHNAVKKETESLEQNIKNVQLIILDSWNSCENGSFKKLKNLIDSNPGIPIIVMQTIDDFKFLEGDKEEIPISNEFEILHLIGLPRNQIRQFVSQYNKSKRIDDDNKLLDKVIADLDCLNMHRTPYNCLTLLKVSEKHFDESPVNRTKFIEMILFVLFDLGEIPIYKTKPDVKDCEFVLGKFCELLIMQNTLGFTKSFFLNELATYCKEKFIELDIQIVFDVLYSNKIIVSKDELFVFRSSFWVYYFAAKRMHTDEKFRNFIFTNKRYTSFPEIIEFYTGIDRNRNDALEILLSDLTETCNIVQTKIGMSGSVDPLTRAKWRPTEETINKMQDELSENVINSNLPDIIKDQYVDRNYNQVRPYIQSLHRIFEDYSLNSLMRRIKASSTALRNTDYGDPLLKQNLLKEIYKSWEQLSKVLFALAPILANNGSAAFDDTTFYLNGDFGNTYDEKINRILQSNPTNVVGYFQEDMYSPKIAPLLFNNFINEQNSLMKHHQALLVIFKRPNHWRQHIEDYIVSLNKDSFYLYDTVNALRTKYKFDFADPNELRDLKYLAKMGLAKNEFGDKKPLPRIINKISDSNFPKRELD